MQNLDSLEKIISNRLTIGITIFSLFAIAITNLIGTNMLATRGFDLAEIETKTLNLEKENRQIQVSIDEKSQFSKLEEVATSKGYHQLNDIVFMPTPATTAMR